MKSQQHPTTVTLGFRQLDSTSLDIGGLFRDAVCRRTNAAIRLLAARLALATAKTREWEFLVDESSPEFPCLFVDLRGAAAAKRERAIEAIKIFVLREAGAPTQASEGRGALPRPEGLREARFGGPDELFAIDLAGLG